jgi:transcription elongation factor Elf1
MSAQPFALRSDPASINGAQRSNQDDQFRADLSIKLTCPNCNDPTIDLIEEFGSGDLVCGGCGEPFPPLQSTQTHSDGKKT